MNYFTVLLALCLAVQVSSAFHQGTLKMQQTQSYLKQNKINSEIDESSGKLDKTLASNCLDFGDSSGIHTLYLPGVAPFSALCESRYMGPGWTVIQRRFNGSVNFNRSWNEYLNGFGDVRGEFFIGLEKLHKMTSSQSYDLLIYLRSYDLRDHFTYTYSDFVIGNQTEAYAVKSLSRSDGPMTYSIGQKFSTYDRDNDNYWFINCAEEFKGGWWFNSCENNKFANLNGDYLSPESINNFKFGAGIYYGYSYKSAQMMIRPKSLNRTILK